MTDTVGEGTPGVAGVVTVRMEGVPMTVYLQASEHGDELMREFALMAATPGGGDGADGAAAVPVRLTGLVEELRSRFSRFTLGPESALAQAAVRGDTTIDVVYTIPPDVAGAAIHLGNLLDEADEFCLAGNLLTLATPPEAVAFRRWFLGEFARQVDGHPPTPWSEWKP